MTRFELTSDERVRGYIGVPRANAGTQEALMATISRAAWQACTDPATKRRFMAARNTYNRARRQRTWARRRQVYHLWYVWRDKFGPHRGLQRLIAQHLGGVHRSTVSRDFAALGLRGRVD